MWFVLWLFGDLVAAKLLWWFGDTCGLCCLTVASVLVGFLV